MLKALVLGGNNFFGKKLVKVLLDSLYEVTLLNRGNKIDGFGTNVKRIICDRNDTESFKKLISSTYDVVFDQCCFDYHQAKNACEVFQNKTQKYIYTSSVSAYCRYGVDLKEDNINLEQVDLSKIVSTEENYGLGKLQAEKAFYEFANFPVTMVRFPIVVDENDATRRLQEHIEAIQNKKEIYFPNIEAKMSLVSADDAAKALFFLGKSNHHGPINVASPEPIKLSMFMKIIEDKTNGELILSQNKDYHSSYGIHEDWYINCSKLEGLGLQLEEINQYLPNMIKNN